MPLRPTIADSPLAVTAPKLLKQNGSCVRSVLKKLKNTSIAPIGTLNTLELFHYLHEKNKDLVPKIDAVIKDNTKSGELKKMRDKFEKEYLDAIN